MGHSEVGLNPKAGLVYQDPIAGSTLGKEKMTVDEALRLVDQWDEHGCSMEEKDHLIRSTKKIKSTTVPEDASMCEYLLGITESGANSAETEPSQAINPNGREEAADKDQMEIIEGNHNTSRSFKQALLRSRFNESRNEKNFECDVEEISSDEEDESTAKSSEAEDELMDEERDGVSKVKIPKAFLQKIREPWKKCLIVRLLGKSIGYKLFMVKMTKIWGLQADFEALDIGNGFFIVKFDMVDDYMKVFIGGPWIVMDHYVTVRKWQQDFKSDEPEEDITIIWVQFPTLPIEYYNEKALYHIAKVLGIPLKIDINTAMAARGKYARVCVEMDLRKPLISHFSIGKYTYRIEYEHIHSLCFSCGRIGHRREACQEIPRQMLEKTQGTNGEDNQKLETSTSTNIGPESKNATQKLEANPGTFGPWMTVSKRKKNPKNSSIQKEQPIPRSNSFKVFKEGGAHSKGHTTHAGKDKTHRGKAHLDTCFKYKAKANSEKQEMRGSTEEERKNKKEEIRLGKAAVADMKIRDPKTLLNPTKRKPTLIDPNTENRQTKMEEEGENLPTLKHTLIQDRVMMAITPGKEVFDLIASEGWHEEVKV
ncbi:unnamed protein product [Camellia sinensis]